MAPMSSQGKRKHDAIDLTGDNDAAISSQSRNQAPSQDDHDIWVAQEEHEAEDIIMSSQDGDEESMTTYQLYGVLATKIVGVQYYRGIASNGEYVVVRREPSNQYDSNAIKVENVQRTQIGHIPRAMASKLAKYMDRGALLVEGSLSGSVGTYDCPISLKLFGTSEPVERANLRSQMKADRLPCTVIDEKEREAKKRKGEELKKAAAAKKSMMSRGKAGRGQSFESSSQTGFAGSQSQGDGAPSQSLDDIMEASQRFNPREMGEVVEKFGAGEDVLSQMPMAECPEHLATSLLPYQRQALAWLLEKENPKNSPEGSDEAVQLWKPHPRSKGVYINIATNYAIQGKPELASGGILSDDMGLGKTLEMISLMIADPLKCDSRKTTLIVAPVGVMTNWSGQIAQHVQKEHALQVLIYHGAGKKVMKPEQFQTYDVVITSYGSLTSEYFGKNAKNPSAVPRATGLYSVDWRRIILDEGHTIRNPQTKSALAANNLIAQSRWILTGTPIINTLRDLYSLVRFLRLTGGLERLDVFNSVLIRPLKAGDVNASLLLQALMATICLRRKKEMKFVDLRLPELSEYVHKVDFHPSEREKYDALQAEAQGLLRTVQRGHGSEPNTYRHLLEVLLRLRQVCNHWKLCGERVTTILAALETQKSVDLTPENKTALQAMLQLSIESHEDCPICLEPLHNPVITNCAHAFGKECIEQVIETQHRCPMCRAEPLDHPNLVPPALELGETSATNRAEEDMDQESSSSKIEALLSILSATSKKHPGTKTVIFSQWTSFLDIIQSRLTAALPPTTHIARIDGSLRPAQRDAALTALNEDPDCTILLASLAVCSVGLNLVAASQVILADSWWAPAIEDQAVDRVHRLGQKKATTVWRLVVDGTVEERVLGIQGEKRKLMGLAFAERVGETGGRGKGMESRGARLGDIERLLK